MARYKFLAALLVIVAFGQVLASGVPGTLWVQDSSAGKKAKPKKPVITDASDGRPVLWREAEAPEALDLYWGPGGQKGAPDPSGKFTFLERDTKGTQKKIIVKDDKDREWIVKFGPEARPETAATRIVWAVGYHADEDYFVKQVHIDGWEGEADNVRFKRRHHGFKQIGYWRWEQNPFLGTRELNGLKALMVLLNNWDLKYDNNKIVAPKKEKAGDPDERIYYVGDLGATFGKTGSLAFKLHVPRDPPAGSKDKPSQYARQAFIDGVRDGMVRFHYKGKDQSALKDVRVEDAKWIGGLLMRLTDKQIADAFRASGYSDGEVTTLVEAMRDRIGQLASLR
jgi:hypothetical protein